MVVDFRGGSLRLKDLTDVEYTDAQNLARMSGVSLETCPTCSARETEIPDSGGVKEFVNGMYKFRGMYHPCECQAQIALRARYLLANIGSQYMTLDWEDFDGSPEAIQQTALYLNKWEGFKRLGMGMEFAGKDLGVGKTFAATHIGKELIKRGQRVFFVPFVEMVSAFERDDAQNLEDKMRGVTYLILDEILPPTSSRQHEFYATKLEALIRHRTNHNLPTIITTNMLEEELGRFYPRTYSLLRAKQIRIDMSGEDARLKRIPLENLELVANDECRPVS